MRQNFQRLFVAACLGQAWCATGLAVPPQSSDPAKGETFVPTGELVRNTRTKFLLRRSVEQGEGAPPSMPLDIAGKRNLAVICVEFPNRPHQVPGTALSEMLFGPNNRGSLRQYYADLSHGKLQVSGEVTNWFQAPNNDAVYEGSNLGRGPQIGPLLKFGLVESDKDLDFGLFDNDGRDGLPNSGDDDGRVDLVMFVHSEAGGETTGDSIWSHMHNYSKFNPDNNGMFVTTDVRKDRDGHPMKGPDGKDLYITVEDYTIQPSLDASSTENNPVLARVGVFCHEFGHSLALPDLYDRTYNSHGLGNWCLMAYGNNGGDGKHADRPVALSAWCRYYLGWTEPQELSLSQLIKLKAAHDGDQVLRWTVPGTDNREYFLIEHRSSQPVPGNGNLHWDQFLPGSGLAIWHVDHSVGWLLPNGIANPRWPFAERHCGQNDDCVKLTKNQSNPFEIKRPLVAMIQADRRRDLESGGTSPKADVGDLFFGNNTDFTDDETGIAGSRSYTGKKTGFAIRNIAMNAQGQAEANVEMDDVLIAEAPAAAPPVAAAPPAVPSLSTPALRSFKQLEMKLGSKLERVDRSSVQKMENSAIELNAAKQAVLELMGEQQIQFVQEYKPQFQQRAQSDLKVSKDFAQFLEKASVIVRTTELGDEDKPRNEAEKAIQAFRGKSGSPTTVRYAADNQRVTQLDHLNVKQMDAMPAEDAKLRLNDENFKKALGVDDHQFSAVTQDPASSKQQFQQTMRLPDNEIVPIWGTDISLFYGTDGQLKSVTNQTLAKVPTFSMPGDIATIEEVKQIAGKAAGLDAAGLDAAVRQEPKKGLYVPSLQSGANAAAPPVLSYLVLIDQGADSKPMLVYINAKTRKVLDIR